MIDLLGDRIKSQYEDRTRYMLPRRTYCIIRFDQKCGHNYTKHLNKPFDRDYISDYDQAIINILPEIQGAKFAYLQSDECSILLTDFDNTETNAWFDGNIQKIISVSTSLLTSEFNRLRLLRYFQPKVSDETCGLTGYSLKWLFDCVQKDITGFKFASFDARVFSVPDRIEVYNTFVWRNKDCIRNSINSAAQHFFSHKELQNKSCSEVLKMLEYRYDGWNDLLPDCKYGRLIVKENYIPNNEITRGIENAIRTRWISMPAWKFTENEFTKNNLLEFIPLYENGKHQIAVLNTFTH